MLTARTDSDIGRSTVADIALPEYDDFVEYCEYVELSCLEHDLSEQISEHKAIDEL